jgi:hypothetical protein
MDMVINRAKFTENTFITLHSWDTGVTFLTLGMKKFGKVI